MRDPKRIRKFCNQLAAVWEEMPDLRFGQLMEDIWLQMDRTPAYYAEDDEMLAAIKRVGAKMTTKYTHTAER